MTLNDKSWKSLNVKVNKGSELSVAIIPTDTKFNRKIELMVGNSTLSPRATKQLQSGQKMISFASKETVSGDVKVKLLKEEPKEKKKLINSKLTVIITKNNAVLFTKEQLQSSFRLIRANKSRLKSEKKKAKPNAGLIKKYEAIIEREELRKSRLQRLLRSNRKNSWN